MECKVWNDLCFSLFDLGINGTKVECKGEHVHDCSIYILVLMEPKWNVKTGDIEVYQKVKGINGTKVECKGCRSVSSSVRIESY